MKKILSFILFLSFMFCGVFLLDNTIVSGKELENINFKQNLPDLYIYEAPGNNVYSMWANSSNFVTFIHQDPFQMGYNTITVIAVAMEEGYYSTFQYVYTEYGVFYTTYMGEPLEWYCGLMGNCIDAAVFVNPSSNIFAGEPRIMAVIASLR